MQRRTLLQGGFAALLLPAAEIKRLPAERPKARVYKHYDARE